MRLSAILASSVLATTGSAFVFYAYPQADCAGWVDEAQRIDVPHGTCSNTGFNFPIRSIWVSEYGGHGQKGTFYNQASCDADSQNQWFWVGGHSDAFKEETCITFDFDVNAVSSKQG